MEPFKINFHVHKRFWLTYLCQSSPAVIVYCSLTLVHVMRGKLLQHH